MATASKVEKFPKIKVKTSLGKPSNKTSFKVKGATLDDVRDALNKHDHWGEYTCPLSTGWKTTGKQKYTTEISLTTKPEIAMPVWSTYSKASKDDKAAWDAMYAKLLKHEKNHHALALEVIALYIKEVDDQNSAIDVVNKKIEKETDPKKQEKLRDDFDAMTESVLKARLKKLGEDLQKVQDDYDAKSDHGKKEGVKL